MIATTFACGRCRRRRGSADAAARRRVRDVRRTSVARRVFILSLKWLSHPSTARRGVLAGEIGMVAGRHRHAAHVRHRRLQLDRPSASSIGSLIGAPMAIWMPMTAVPQRTALVARLRRPGRGAGRHRPLLPDDLPDMRSHPFTMGDPGDRGAARRPHVHRQPDGVRQAAGADPQRDQGLPRPERRQPFRCSAPPLLCGVWLIVLPGTGRGCSRS